MLAEAQLTDKTGSPDPGRYRELVDALIWSAQPRLTRMNTGRLARLLPKLLPMLRDGLATIGYPAAKTTSRAGRRYACDECGEYVTAGEGSCWETGLPH